MVDRDELVRQEHAFWDAAGDGDFYRERFLDEGRCVFDVAILDKAMTIAGVDRAPSWGAVSFEGEELVHLADDVVALVYTARAQRDGDPYAARVSSTYVRRGDRWLLGLHQQTPIL
jgi:ketosteroid isomerase-like protein